MGTLNIAEWSPDQVAEWMSGLGPKVEQYVPELHKKGLNGEKLLTLRCDDLEYLGIHIIGHQELLLEAVEHLRNFHYEISRECVQQLALRVSSAAASLARALRHHFDPRLETQSLADVARTVQAVKPLVCWLDRWPLCSGSPLAERKAALLKLSLEAATCAQRDRFAEQPARAVAAAAAAVAAVADYIIQDVSDPTILQPAWLGAVALPQGERALGFEVVPSFCGHHQLAHIRFASPAHASGLVHEADEIVQVGGRCVIGWSGEAVERLCAHAARGGPDLQLRLRRRGARALPALPTPPLRAPRPRARPRLPPLHAHLPPHRYELPRAWPAAPPPPPAPAPRSPSSSDSDALSPPASPTLHPGAARLYPPKPAARRARRHSVCGAEQREPAAPRAVERFWRELQQQRWVHGSSPEPDDTTLYRRDKAVSCSTGLQLSPRPRTCLGVPRQQPAPLSSPLPASPPAPQIAAGRGKLDKSHSTPAYDFEPPPEPGPLAAQTIPESPTTPTADGPSPPRLEKAGQILDFKKSSSQIEEAIQQRNRRTNVDEERSDAFTDEDIRLIDDDSKLEIVETVNVVLSESRSAVESMKRAVSRDFRGVEDEEMRASVKVSPDDTSSDDQIPIPVKYPKPRITERYRPTEFPPEPPPRPSYTQRASREPVPPPREHPVPPPREQAATGPREQAAAGQREQVATAHVRDALRARARAAGPRDDSPLRPLRPGDHAQSSLSLRHINKHDIHLVSTERREMPALNGESDQPPPAERRRDDIVIGAASEHEPRPAACSPAAGGVRGIFPSSKSRSLKKKNSILAKRRGVAARSLAARGAAGRVWQRVRARAGPQPRWAARHLLLAHNLLYAYRSPECSRADCMIYLEGFTVCAAGEVKSRAHAFKVYHTGVAFYFACDTRDAMLAWIQLIHRATLLPSLLSSAMELSKQFSETDYSETESDTETSERRNEREKEREREKDREKEKSKFGSLKKLTHRAGRSESQENVNQPASTSLDRKYLRFFSRARPKDDTKTVKGKQSGVPVPTEHYRSYRRVTADASPGPAPGPAPGHSPGPAPSPRAPPSANKLPKPINYIHASNPNLLDFEKSDFITKPDIQVPKPKVHKPDNFVGFVTLEEFMLKKQEEERRQTHNERAPVGGAAGGVAGGGAGGGARELQRRLDRIVPDVIYGELSQRHGDGYELVSSATRANTRRVSSDTHCGHGAGAPEPPRTPPTQAGNESSAGGVSRLRLMFGARRELPAERPARGEYPHLQCPPTFQPESYSLARPPRDAGPRD